MIEMDPNFLLRIQLDVGRLQIRTCDLQQRMILALQEESWSEVARIMRDLEGIYRKEWADLFASLAEQVESAIWDRPRGSELDRPKIPPRQEPLYGYPPAIRGGLDQICDPQPRMVVYDADRGLLCVYDGSVWCDARDLG